MLPAARRQGALVVRWTDNSAGETSFIVQARPGDRSAAWSDLAVVPSTSTARTGVAYSLPIGPPPAGERCFRVIASNDLNLAVAGPVCAGQ